MKSDTADIPPLKAITRESLQAHTQQYDTPSNLHTEETLRHLCNAGTELPGLFKIEGRALDWLQVTSGDVLVCHWCVVVPADRS